mmetsp:Transcript_24304/g.77791  ORF Transcript_24304/g.77791 Transcript_24304/m.77791 type:complete len:418 (+) Transcript_24304:544-1797(+)
MLDLQQHRARQLAAQQPVERPARLRLEDRVDHLHRARRRLHRRRLRLVLAPREDLAHKLLQRAVQRLARRRGRRRVDARPRRAVQLGEDVSHRVHKVRSPEPLRVGPELGEQVERGACPLVRGEDSGGVPARGDEQGSGQQLPVCDREGRLQLARHPARVEGAPDGAEGGEVRLGGLDHRQPRGRDRDAAVPAGRRPRLRPVERVRAVGREAVRGRREGLVGGGAEREQLAAPLGRDLDVPLHAAHGRPSEPRAVLEPLPSGACDGDAEVVQHARLHHQQPLGAKERAVARADAEARARRAEQRRGAHRRVGAAPEEGWHPERDGGRVPASADGADALRGGVQRVQRGLDATELRPAQQPQRLGLRLAPRRFRGDSAAARLLLFCDHGACIVQQLLEEPLRLERVPSGGRRRHLAPQ